MSCVFVGNISVLEFPFKRNAMLSKIYMCANFVIVKCTLLSTKVASSIGLTHVYYIRLFISPL